MHVNLGSDVFCRGKGLHYWACHDNEHTAAAELLYSAASSCQRHAENGLVQVMDSVLSAAVPLAGLVGGGCGPTWSALHALGMVAGNYPHSYVLRQWILCRYSPNLESLARRHCLLHQAAASAWRDFRL